MKMNSNASFRVLVAAILCVSGTSSQGQQSRYGLHVGPLNSYQHGVSGDVYVVDSRTIHLRGFNYDGSGPAGYFLVGKSGVVGTDGRRIPDETGRQGALRTYRNEDITLTLPEGLTLNDISWLSVWCDDFTVNFGDIKFPRNLDYPKPKKIDPLPNLEHGVKSDRIVVVDAQTFLIPQFSYDGQAPDAFFFVGKGSKPSSSGTRVPDENGSLTPLGPYKDKTIVLTLPGDLTVYDIDYLSVWCDEYSVDFGHVKIPKSLNVPPSLRMLGVAPQTKLNCEVLKDDLALEVRWAVAGESIVIQLVGKLEDKQYVAFGLSGAERRPRMVGGDVVVAWMEHATGKGFAHDYYLEAKGQCAGESGSCPDEVFESKGNNVRLLNTALVNGFTMITYQRPLKASDRFDQAIVTDREQAVIWAVGAINSQGTVSYHNNLRNGPQQALLINFGRQPQWNCPIPEDEAAGQGATPAAAGGGRRGQQQQPGSANKPASPGARPASPAPTAATPGVQPWFIPPIPCYEPEDGVFYAHIGPTGGKAGYESIVGRVGWGVAWYVNGLLVPQITVVRGKTYTFVVEAGNDAENPTRFHPFYITDDADGGYAHKSDEERKRVRIFAGAERDAKGEVVPTGVGRACQWTEDPQQPASQFPSFGAYQRSLTLKCEDGQPGIVQWTPDANTPDTVYYQCFTHRHLGWKINVVDRCTRDRTFAASHLHVTSVSKDDKTGASGPVAVVDYENDDPFVDEVLEPGVPYPSRGGPQQVADRRNQYVDSENFRRKNPLQFGAKNKDESQSKSSLPVVKGPGGAQQEAFEEGNDFDEEPVDVQGDGRLPPVSFSSFPEFGQKKTAAAVEEEEADARRTKPGIGKEEVKDGVVIIEAVPIKHDSSRAKPSINAQETDLPSPVYVGSDAFRGQQQQLQRPAAQNEASVPPRRRPVPLAGFQQHSQSHQQQPPQQQQEQEQEKPSKVRPPKDQQKPNPNTQPPSPPARPQRPVEQSPEAPFKVDLPQLGPGPQRRPTFEDPRVVLPSAANNGFHPNTVILEGGFKPIRKDTDPELPPAFSEHRPGQQQQPAPVGPPGSGNPFDSAVQDTFNPVFRPSPSDLSEAEGSGSRRPQQQQRPKQQGAIIRPIPSVPPRPHENDLPTPPAPVEGVRRPEQEPRPNPAQGPAKPAAAEAGASGQVFFPDEEEFPEDFEEPAPPRRQQGPAAFGQGPPQRPAVSQQQQQSPPLPGLRAPLPPQFVGGAGGQQQQRPGVQGGRPIPVPNQSPVSVSNQLQQQGGNRPFGIPPQFGQGPQRLENFPQQIPFRPGQPQQQGNPNNAAFGPPPPPPGVIPFGFRPPFSGPNGNFGLPPPPPGFRGRRPPQGFQQQQQQQQDDEDFDDEPVSRPPPGNNRRQSGPRGSSKQEQKKRRRRPAGGNRRRRPVEPEAFDSVNVDRADVDAEEQNIFVPQGFQPDPKFRLEVPPGLGEGVVSAFRPGQRPQQSLRPPSLLGPVAGGGRPLPPSPAFRSAGPRPFPLAPPQPLSAAVPLPLKDVKSVKAPAEDAKERAALLQDQRSGSDAQKTKQVESAGAAQGSESEILSDVWSTIETQSSGQRGAPPHGLVRRSGAISPPPRARLVDGNHAPVRLPRSADSDPEPEEASEPETQNHHRKDVKGSHDGHGHGHAAAESEPEPRPKPQQAVPGGSAARTAGGASLLLLASLAVARLARTSLLV